MYSVLIVDDEAVQREYLRMQIPLLDPRFVIAGEASDGQEALEFLERTPIDLLVTDIKMPVMNGLELCRQTYVLYPRMKAVILTGYEDFEYVREALRYKAEQYLLKPLNREATRAALADLAAQFELARAEEAKLRGLHALSEEARRQVARRFLQALIAGSQAEIGALFPLTCRMNIPLFEGEGILLLLEIDEISLRDKRIPPRDFPVFRYIVNQIATELIDVRELAWTMFDERERTAILLSGTEPSALKPSARELFALIRGHVLSATGLTLTGGLGIQMEDVLQLEASYQSALTATYQRFRDGGDRLYETENEEEVDTAASHLASSVHSLLQIVKRAAIDPHPDRRLLGVPVLADLFAREQDVPASYAFALGAFLLRELERDPVRLAPEALTRAWHKLAERLPPEAPGRTLFDVQESYQAALGALQAETIPEEKPSDCIEQRLIDEIRAYIELNYAEPISLAMLSDKFRASQQRISTAFHKHVGLPYVKYMTRVRMENAARLLAERPEAKIFEVAELTGYANVRHFTYVFKKHFGVTPGEYTARPV